MKWGEIQIDLEIGVMVLLVATEIDIIIFFRVYVDMLELLQLYGFLQGLMMVLVMIILFVLGG